MKNYIKLVAQENNEIDFKRMFCLIYLFGFIVKSEKFATL